MHVTVREAVKEDSATISRITAVSWRKTYHGIVPQPYLDSLRDDFWVPIVDDWINTGRFRILLAEADGIPAGTVSYGQSREAERSDWCELVTMYVLPEYLKCGIGRILMDTAVANARRQGFQKIFLWALRDNANARRFYEHVGWHLTQDTLISPIMGEDLVDVRYVREL